MESLKARLAGKEGLRQKVAEGFHPTVPRRDRPMSRSRVGDTKAVGVAVMDRRKAIVARMGRLK